MSLGSFIAGIGKALAGFAIALGTLFGFRSAPLTTQEPPQGVVLVPQSMLASSTAKTEAPAPPATPAGTAAVQTAEPAASAPETPQPPAVDQTMLNASVRAAVVNILCTTQNGGYLEPISGSGVIIDPRGVVLTNAHVGQFFLLRDFPTPGNVQCVVRTGSPAKAEYTAELLYLPPAWVSANASELTSDEPTGTGEDDYAFLYITGTTDPSMALPASFPYIAPSEENLYSGEEMLLASYPAGFLQGITIETNLYETSAYASIGDIYAFSQDDTWADLFSVPGTVVSQSGSSGGAAVRSQDGTLAGIIVTDSVATTTAARDLRAVTVAHIEHSLAAQGLNGISSLLSNNLAATARQFSREIAPSETAELIAALTSGSN